jgi:hypothetical protein
LNRTNEAVALCLATNAVGLSLLDRRRVALHADAKLDAEIEGLFIRKA